MKYRPHISFVVPVFNGATTIGNVVSSIAQSFAAYDYEIVLVNDGSSDNSEQACLDLLAHYQSLIFVNLSKNFGEHNAVLAGLSRTSGHYVAVLDDDGQNPPSEVLKMMHAAERGAFDVVYGRYQVKRHHWFRNLGSRLNDAVATILLNKPAGLYLSSFKVMSRFIVDEIVKYKGGFPYIDGLIFRATRNITEVIVEHKEREQGVSNYTLRRLVRLWLNMFLGFSILPLRVASLLGLAIAMTSGFSILIIVLDRLFIAPDTPHGIPSVLAMIVFFSGIQLLLLGLVGEYLGRMFMDHSGVTSYITRYVRSNQPLQSLRSEDGASSLPSVSGE